MRVAAGRWSPLGLALVLLLAGCASRSPSPPPAEHHPYVIGTGDYLRINFWRNPEISRDVVVRMDGLISLPFISDVQAEGLTPMELKQVLTREFSEHVTDPDVTVIVIKVNCERLGKAAASGSEREKRIFESLCPRPPQDRPEGPPVG